MTGLLLRKSVCGGVAGSLNGRTFKNAQKKKKRIKKKSDLVGGTKTAIKGKRGEVARSRAIRLKGNRRHPGPKKKKKINVVLYERRVANQKSSKPAYGRSEGD